MNRGFLKEKLGNYQVDPPGKVWDAISEQIGHGRRRRGMYILLMATAASIALAVGLGIRFFGPELSPEQSAVEERGPEMQRLEDLAPEGAIRETVEAPAAEFSPGPLQAISRAENKTLALQESIVVERNEEDFPVEISEPESKGIPEGYADQETVEEVNVVNDTARVRDPGPDLLPDSVPGLNMDPVPVVEPGKVRNSRWMVGAAISPLYSYRDAEAVRIPPDQAESGLLSYSTGVHIRYRRNSRFAIETGIYYNRTGIAIGAPGIKIFSQQRDNMLFGIGSESADINTVSNSVGNIVAYSGDIFLNGYKITAENGSDALQSQALTDVRVAESGIQQHLDYLELPFNLRYSLIDRTFELQLVGGISTNFLIGNSVTMEGPSGREEIGYLSNVNTVNYAGNAGLGMIYHMGRKMSLFLEPRFRYFLNSVNDTSLPATRPYSIGFYTGLSYTF